jgi:SAM-dependent methyltransferase
MHLDVRKSRIFKLDLFKLIRYRIENLSIFYVFHPFKIYEYKELVRDAKFSKSDIILDIGCGNGKVTLLIGKKCKKIYGIDILKERLVIARYKSHLLKKKINSEFKYSTLENAGFNEEFFDKIISICVLEHISNYIEVLKIAYKTLKKGGKMIFSVDSMQNIKDKSLINYHKKKFDVKQYFRKEDLKKELEIIGFRKIIIYPICKSEYAKKRFFKLMTNISLLDYITSIFEYFILKKKEIISRYKDTGLYFVVKCSK